MHYYRQTSSLRSKFACRRYTQHNSQGAAAMRPFAAISAATNYLYFLVFIDR